MVGWMEYIYDQIKEILDEYEMDYEFKTDDPHVQFIIYSGISQFTDDIIMYLYVNHDQFLLTIVTEKVTINAAFNEAMNEWNKESLLFKAFVDEAGYLVFDSYHSFVIKEDFSNLFSLILETFLDEVEYFGSISKHFILETPDSI